MSLRILRGFTGIIDDNVNLALEIDSLKLPALEEATEAFQPGGSDLEIEIAGMGVKALKCDFKLKTRNPAATGLFGGPPGKRHRFTGKSLVIDEKDGAEHEHAVDILGRFVKVDPEDAKGGKPAGYDFSMSSIWTYTEYWDQRVLHRFNFELGGWDIRNFEPVNEARRSMLFS